VRDELGNEVGFVELHGAPIAEEAPADETKQTRSGQVDDGRPAETLAPSATAKV
jgi:hypothetical protein